MKRTIVVLLVLAPFYLCAQPRISGKKYPSLLWEISGKGMKKTSYLFGTMHVSSKLAFHLADSFYLGLRNADIVALETNPESWQEDMSKYQGDEGRTYGTRNRGRTGTYMSEPDDFLIISTLEFYKYDKKMERALYSNPSTINNLLYRSYGNQSSDFEEDTYLDMYIYQCGKKWGKKVAGVERYDESMKLMAEAYRDAAKDRNRKERSYNQEEGFSSGKLQEAYRTGNLDWLDSINKYNSFSEAFDEKFLYKRNEIQANSIDSILRSGQSLFVGVGAAHLPGDRGVIEMLRDHGYRLRPVKMGQRDSQHKTMVETLRVPVKFARQQSDDGVYSVEIPGKFYKFGSDNGLEQQQYADMANGSYYMVTRVMTNAWMWDLGVDKVFHGIDSVLYENIPGKIVSKTNITRNGYKGIDITNRTRRGDLQRYNIFVTPFEILIFKMGGTGDYVKNGEEANRFFGSIKLSEYHTATPAAWKKYSPAIGGFAIDMPHEPFIGNDGSWIYDAEDKTTNTQYRLIRTDIHNYSFAEEDTFDLALMEESFQSSEFVDKLLSRKQTMHKGYPALDCRFLSKSGSIFLTRFIIQGPHYYSLIAHGKKESPKMKDFLSSFQLTPYKYGAAQERTDSSLYYSVKTPVFPDILKNKQEIPGLDFDGGSDEEESEENQLIDGAYRGKIIENDTTGEKIYVNFFKSRRYFYSKDSTIFDSDDDLFPNGDSTWIVRMKKKYERPDKMKVRELILSDTGSSRIIWNRSYYRNGIGFSLTTQIDTLTGPSAFVKTFFETFTPADTLKGSDPFVKKTKLFVGDFLSADSVAHKRALRGLYSIRFDSTDFTHLKNLIDGLTWKEKKYLDTKKLLIGKLDHLKTKEASDYAKSIYYAAGDTVELQYAALEVLLEQATQYSFNVFKDIINTEPPVISSDNENENYSYLSSINSNVVRSFGRSQNYGSNFMYRLHDSLKLTRTILPELLPLINLDDYKEVMMRLLGRMVDSNFVKSKDYENYFSKFLIEAKQELRKQSIAERKKAIAAAEEKKDDPDNSIYVDEYEYNNKQKDYGNDRLSLYATLLAPFWETNAAVPTLVKQMFASNDKKLKYNLLILMMRNKREYPDSLISYFASLDEYRYELYKDLRDINRAAVFPLKYNSHLALGKSKLMGYSNYFKPDSLVFIERLPAVVKGKKGFVYFYKYRAKKDDITWRLASVGLVPEDAKQFEFADWVSTKTGFNSRYPDYDKGNRVDLTDVSGPKIKEDEPIRVQLDRQLKKMLYSLRKSAKEFYPDGDRKSGIDEVISITGYRD
jgi:uncharacterized protein YbaP (TraB family)